MDLNLLRGNLDLILLSVLEREGGYGQDISKRVDALTGAKFGSTPGASTRPYTAWNAPGS